MALRPLRALHLQLIFHRLTWADGLFSYFAGEMLLLGIGHCSPQPNSVGRGVNSDRLRQIRVRQKRRGNPGPKVESLKLWLSLRGDCVHVMVNVAVCAVDRLLRAACRANNAQEHQRSYFLSQSLLPLAALYQQLLLSYSSGCIYSSSIHSSVTASSACGRAACGAVVRRCRPQSLLGCRCGPPGSHR